VSSDPITDLAGTLKRFADAFRRVLGKNQRPADGSPAAKEMAGEPFAGEWGSRPSRDILANASLAAAASTDHMLALASVLKDRSAVFAPYTIMRAAAESAALGCYLTDERIDGRERVRRNLNYRLDGICEQICLLQPFPGGEAAQKVAQNQTQLTSFRRAANQHRFRFNEMSGPGRPAHLDKKQPSAMVLMDAAVARETPGLGAANQRHLSSVAHSKLHGLSRFLVPIEAQEAGAVDGQAAINTNPRTLALELFSGPMCAVGLLEGLRWFTGWDVDDVTQPAVVMLDTWGRVAGIRYPGPVMSAR
jgi:hypothetical protein